MTTTETALFLWLGLVNGVLIWLCFERDRLLKKISNLEGKDQAKTTWLASHDGHMRTLYQCLIAKEQSK